MDDPAAAPANAQTPRISGAALILFILVLVGIALPALDHVSICAHPHTALSAVRGAALLPNWFPGRCIIPRSYQMDASSSASTLDLLQRAAAGDQQAVDQLFARYAPALNRWASGRLPKALRDIADTQDIVQDAMLQTFRNLNGFEYRGEGGFHAYLRQAVLNRVKTEIRRRGRV